MILHILIKVWSFLLLSLSWSSLGWCAISSADHFNCGARYDLFLLDLFHTSLLWNFLAWFLLDELLQRFHILFNFYSLFNADILTTGLYPLASELILLLINVYLLNSGDLSLLGNSDLIWALVTLFIKGLILWLIIVESHSLYNVLLLFLFHWDNLVG